MIIELQNNDIIDTNNYDVNNIDLQGVSEYLSDIIASMIEESSKEYDNIRSRIAELSTSLQEMEKSDLSENADYQRAKDERDIKNALGNLLLKRVASMQRDISDYTPTGFITLGTTVALSVDSVNGNAPKIAKKQFIMKIVQHDTGDARKCLMASDSRVANAILGMQVPDGEKREVEIETPMGNIKYIIERIY